jgi:hypothetical protein
MNDQSANFAAADLADQTENQPRISRINTNKETAINQFAFFALIRG